MPFNKPLETSHKTTRLGMFVTKARNWVGEVSSLEGRYSDWHCWAAMLQKNGEPGQKEGHRLIIFDANTYDNFSNSNPPILRNILGMQKAFINHCTMEQKLRLTDVWLIGLLEDNGNKVSNSEGRCVNLTFLWLEVMVSKWREWPKLDDILPDMGYRVKLSQAGESRSSSRSSSRDRREVPDGYTSPARRNRSNTPVGSRSTTPQPLPSRTTSPVGDSIPSPRLLIPIVAVPARSRSSSPKPSTTIAVCDKVIKRSPSLDKQRLAKALCRKKSALSIVEVARNQSPEVEDSEEALQLVNTSHVDEMSVIQKDLEASFTEADADGEEVSLTL